MPDALRMVKKYPLSLDTGYPQVVELPLHAVVTGVGFEGLILYLYALVWSRRAPTSEPRVFYTAREGVESADLGSVRSVGVARGPVVAWHVFELKEVS